VLLLVCGGGNLGPHSTPSESSARLRPVPTTTTPLGAEFLVEGVVMVFLSALLEFLRGIGLDASTVVVVLITLMSGGFLPLGRSLSGPEPVSGGFLPLGRSLRGPEPVLCFMYYRRGRLFLLIFYFNVIRVRHDLEKIWVENHVF
jgi:hypothetical protein